MPKAKRERRERTDNYHLLQQWCRTPEQRLYEGIRPIVLFGIPPVERAQETGLAERSLGRAADAFDTHGIISLFRPTKAQREDHHRSLPVAMRQLIVDLKAEYADFTDGEIAAICAIQFNGRRPSHHTVRAVLADGPPPQRTQRQFPHYAEIGTPEERRQAVIRLLPCFPEPHALPIIPGNDCSFPVQRGLQKSDGHPYQAGERQFFAQTWTRRSHCSAVSCSRPSAKEAG